MLLDSLQCLSSVTWGRGRKRGEMKFVCVQAGCVFSLPVMRSR